MIFGCNAKKKERNKVLWYLFTVLFVVSALRIGMACYNREQYLGIAYARKTLV